MSRPKMVCEWCGDRIKKGEIPVRAQIVCIDGIVTRMFHFECFKRYTAVIKAVVITEES